MFKANNKNTRKTSVFRFYSPRKRTIGFLTFSWDIEMEHWRRSGGFVVNFEHISHLLSSIDFEKENFSWEDWWERSGQGFTYSKNWIKWAFKLAKITKSQWTKLVHKGYFRSIKRKKYISPSNSAYSN